MVADVFGTLLQDISTALKLSKPLAPDANNSCLVKFKGGIQIQLEMDKAGEYLVLGTDLGAISPGKYRENIFIEALKANGAPGVRYGVFAYSKQTDHLILFEMFNLRDLHATKVVEFFPGFIQKAKVWKEALERGEVPPSVAYATKSAGIFGLK